MPVHRACISDSCSAKEFMLDSIVRYYGNVPGVAAQNQKKTLLVAIVMSIALFICMASVDPFREVRKFHPAQSWSIERVLDRTMPDDIVVWEPLQCRVFKFSQDPVDVYASVGGDPSELSRMLKLDEESRNQLKQDKVAFLQWFGLPLSLKSGREAEFFILRGEGSYTCKLVIRPLAKRGMDSVFDWLCR